MYVMRPAQFLKFEGISCVYRFELSIDHCFALTTFLTFPMKRTKSSRSIGFNCQSNHFSRLCCHGKLQGVPKSSNSAVNLDCAGNREGMLAIRSQSICIEKTRICGRFAQNHFYLCLQYQNHFYLCLQYQQVRLVSTKAERPNHPSNCHQARGGQPCGGISTTMTTQT